MRTNVSRGCEVSAGVDEAGRGPLAGPVIAAAVVLPERYELEGLTDSKRLSAVHRTRLDGLIKSQAICWSIGRADVAEIDRLNIFHASLLAMRRAVEGLSVAPDVSLIDGKWAPPLRCRTITLVKGDLLEPCISAASIVAKVHRDKEMARLHLSYPGYGFDTNKGYATSRHLEALDRLGACAVHRRSFLPVQNALSGQIQLGL